MAFVGLVALLGLWKVTRFAEVPPVIVAGNGVLDVAGNVALLLALRSGSLALVGVAASFYPAVTVMLARLINSEHLRGRQIVGVVLTLVALSVIAVA
jgi:drug/metabolite transporter (DMT)-like permease